MKRRVVVVLAASAIWLLSFGGAEGALERDSLVCGRITPGSIDFFTEFYDGGGGVILLLGYLRLSAATEAIPFSGSAVFLGQTNALKFSVSGSSAGVGVFTFAGKFSLEEQAHVGECFGPSPCSPSGQAVTYTLTLACPLR
jgi:hypothetical protein